MRPWRSTWVASTTTRPAPELASMPRCAMCQSLAQPSVALYWHIGATTIRLSSSTPASLMGENSDAAMSTPLTAVVGSNGEPGGDNIGAPLRRRNTCIAIVFHAGFGHLRGHRRLAGGGAGPAEANGGGQRNRLQASPERTP